MTLPTLICPVHFSSLEGEELAACPAGCRYPIRNGIPRFVASDGYAKPFGLQWQRYRRTQLDSYTGVPTSSTRLKRCLGDELWERVKGLAVLEVGCGAGRFTEVLLARGASVASVDLSEAVDANRLNCPQSAHHSIAQADVYALPFASSQFDVVLCLGVIQHTPDPERTIASLWRHVRPGGWLVMDHYTYRLPQSTRTAPLFRVVLKRLNADTALRVTECMVSLLFPLHKAVGRSYWRQALLTRLSPLMVYFHTIPELSDKLQYEWALLDTHDWLTDWYKHLRTRGQIRRTLQALDAENIWCERGGNGVEARARRRTLAGA